MGYAVKVYRCQICGVRTVDPFTLDERVVCAMCADQIDPWAVSAREQANRRRYSDSKVPTSRYRD